MYPTPPQVTPVGGVRQLCHTVYTTGAVIVPKVNVYAPFNGPILVTVFELLVQYET
jgi:hypothetical protein